MFRTGSKITIIASSKKKGLGPKKGSEGYIGNNENTHIFLQYGFVAAGFDVFFSKYGFEKGSRNEKRRMIFLYPIYDKSIGDTPAQIKSLIKRICSPKSQSVWDEVYKTFQWSSSVSQIALAVPAVNTITDMCLVENDEFYAWVESILSSMSFGEFMLNMSKSGHHTTSSDPIVSSTYLNHEFRNIITYDRTRKRACIDDMIVRYGGRQKFIEVFSILLAFQNSRKNNRGRIDEALRSMFNMLISRVCTAAAPPTRNEVVNTLYSHIANRLFSNTRLVDVYEKFLFQYQKFEKYSESNENTDKLKSAVSEELNNIHKISVGLVGLSSRLLSLHRTKK